MQFYNAGGLCMGVTDTAPCAGCLHTMQTSRLFLHPTQAQSFQQEHNERELVNTCFC